MENKELIQKFIIDDEKENLILEETGIKTVFKKIDYSFIKPDLIGICRSLLTDNMFVKEFKLVFIYNKKTKEYLSSDFGYEEIKERIAKRINNFQDFECELKEYDFNIKEKAELIKLYLKNEEEFYIGKSDIKLNELKKIESIENLIISYIENKEEIEKELVNSFFNKNQELIEEKNKKLKYIKDCLNNKETKLYYLKEKIEKINNFPKEPVDIIFQTDEKEYEIKTTKTVALYFLKNGEFNINNLKGKSKETLKELENKGFILKVNNLININQGKEIVDFKELKNKTF